MSRPPVQTLTLHPIQPKKTRSGERSEGYRRPVETVRALTLRSGTRDGGRSVRRTYVRTRVQRGKNLPGSSVASSLGGITGVELVNVNVSGIKVSSSVNLKDPNPEGVYLNLSSLG